MPSTVNASQEKSIGFLLCIVLEPPSHRVLAALASSQSATLHSVSYTISMVAPVACPLATVAVQIALPSDQPLVFSFFFSLTLNLFESELPNLVGEATGCKHRARERQTQANNNKGMIGAKAHKHHDYSVPDADPMGVSGASHSRKQ